MANTIKSWWGRLINHWIDRRRRKLVERLTQDSHRVLQLMEHDDQMYISYKGVPIVNTNILNTSAIEALKASRIAWVKFALAEYGVTNETNV